MPATSCGCGVGEIGDDLPVVRRGDGERERGLEVGLVEAGEDPARVGDLELAVEVDLLVDRVDEPVQALAGVHVLRRRPRRASSFSAARSSSAIRAPSTTSAGSKPSAVEHDLERTRGAIRSTKVGRTGVGAGEPDRRGASGRSPRRWSGRGRRRRTRRSPGRRARRASSRVRFVPGTDCSSRRAGWALVRSRSSRVGGPGVAPRSPPSAHAVGRASPGIVARRPGLDPAGRRPRGGTSTTAMTTRRRTHP